MNRSVWGPAGSRTGAGHLLLQTSAPLLALLALVAAFATGCGAAGTDSAPSSPSPSTVRSATPSASVTGSAIPVDGVGLRSFGIANGPATFSLPRGSVATSIVDQANSVVVVLSAPTPAEVADFLRRTLPAAGFEISDSGGDDTFVFTGAGWSGSFTVGDKTSAVLLRPR